MNHLLGIVAHERRIEQVGKLSVTLNPDVVMVDRDSGVGATENHLAVLRWMNKHCAKGTYHWAVVLEDDAICVDDFRREADAALSYAPTSIVSFYLGTGHPAQHQRKFAEAVMTNAPWIQHPWLRHAVAYAVRAEILPGVIERMTDLSRQRWAPDDALSAFALRYCNISYTNPSLVNHDDSLPPVVGTRTHLGITTSPGRKRPRHAHRFGTRKDWYGGIVAVT